MKLITLKIIHHFQMKMTEMINSCSTVFLFHYYLSNTLKIHFILSSTEVRLQNRIQSVKLEDRIDRCFSCLGHKSQDKGNIMLWCGVIECFPKSQLNNCQARVQVQGLSQISQSLAIIAMSPPTHHHQKTFLSSITLKSLHI